MPNSSGDWPTDFGGPAAYREAIDGDRNDFRGRGQPFDFCSVITRREKLALHRCWFLGYQRGMDAKHLHQDVRSGKLGVDDLLGVIAAHTKTIADQAETIDDQGRPQRNFRDNLTPAWSSSKKSRRSRMAIRRSGSNSRIR
jgi:hypothetical protein